MFALRRILDPAEAAEYASLLYTIKNAKALNEGAHRGHGAAGRARARSQDARDHAREPDAVLHRAADPLHRVSRAQAQGRGVRRRLDQARQHRRQRCRTPWSSGCPTPTSSRRRTPRSTTPTTSSIDTVYYYPAEERNAATKRFRAGEIDIQYDFASEQIDWLKENLPDETRIAPWLGIYYYAINTRKAPFDNPALRQALAMAIDREAITDKVLRTGELPALQLRAARHRQLRRARLRRLEGHALRGAPRQGQGADGRGGLRRRTTRSGSSCATTPRRPTRRWRSRSPRCGSSSASRPSCSTARSRSTTTTSRRATSRSRAPAGSPTTTIRRTSST